MRLLLLVLALTACGRNSITIAMVQQNNSGQDGVATLTDEGSTVRISISIRRSNVGGSQTSHVHFGRCDNVGAIVAGVGMQQLLISDKDMPANIDGGTVFFEATPTVTLAKLREMDHVINVHDARDNSLYVSCGEID